MTRGRTCMVTREGNSSNTEGLTALWWTEAEGQTTRRHVSLRSRPTPKAAFAHLRLVCGFFGINERQSVATQSSVVLQDQSTVRGRPELPAQQAEGQA